MRRGAIGTCFWGNWTWRCVCLLGGSVATTKDQECEEVFVVGAGQASSQVGSHQSNTKTTSRCSFAPPGLTAPAQWSRSTQANGARWRGWERMGGAKGRAWRTRSTPTRHRESRRFVHDQVNVQARGRVGLSSRRDFDGMELRLRETHLHLPQVNKSYHLLRRKLAAVSERERRYIQARFPAPPDRHMERYFTNARPARGDVVRHR